MMERVGHDRFGDGPELQPAWLTLAAAAKLTGISEGDLRRLGYHNRLPCLRGLHARPLMISHRAALDLCGKVVIWRRKHIGGPRSKKTFSVPIILSAEDQQKESEGCHGKL